MASGRSEVWVSLFADHSPICRLRRLALNSTNLCKPGVSCKLELCLPIGLTDSGLKQNTRVAA